MICEQSEFEDDIDCRLIRILLYETVKGKMKVQIVFGFMKDGQLHGYGKGDATDLTFGPDKDENTKGNLLEGFWLNGNQEARTVK